MELIIFILTVSGLVMILNRSSLFNPLREKINLLHTANKKSFVWWFLNSILHCALCCGWWSAVVVFVINLVVPPIVSQGFAYMCIGALFSMLIDSFYRLIERK